MDGWMEVSEGPTWRVSNALGFAEGGGGGGWSVPHINDPISINGCFWYCLVRLCSIEERIVDGEVSTIM
jgi:hypothetical protein